MDFGAGKMNEVQYPTLTLVVLQLPQMLKRVSLWPTVLLLRRRGSLRGFRKDIVRAQTIVGGGAQEVAMFSKPQHFLSQKRLSQTPLLPEHVR